MPAPIVLSTLDPETKRVPNPPPGEPVIATDVRFRDGSRGSVPVSSPAGLIFSESFDDQPDWTSDEIILGPNSFDNTKTLPGWYWGAARSTWSPATGYTEMHPVVEVLASNVAKTRTGSGKSMVHWRESIQDGQYNADSVQYIYLSPEGYDEVYCEFWFTASNAMIQAAYDGDMGASKVFRVFHFDENYPIYLQIGDENKPSLVWDVSAKNNAYGARNFLAMLARGPNDITATIEGLTDPTTLGGETSLSYSAIGTAGALVGGGDAQLTDYKNGGFITTSPVMPDQVFGDESQWVKMGFYVKMNSAPEVADGAYMQWFNGQRIVNSTGIPWVREGFEMRKFNCVGIGGNKQFASYPTADMRQDWFAIDDLKIYSGIPDGEGLI